MERPASVCCGSMGNKMVTVNIASVYAFLYAMIETYKC